MARFAGLLGVAVLVACIGVAPSEGPVSGPDGAREVVDGPDDADTASDAEPRLLFLHTLGAAQQKVPRRHES